MTVKEINETIEKVNALYFVRKWLAENAWTDQQKAEELLGKVGDLALKVFADLLEDKSEERPRKKRMEALAPEMFDMLRDFYDDDEDYDMDAIGQIIAQVDGTSR